MLAPELRRRVRARLIPKLAALLYCSDVGDERASLDEAPQTTRERYERAAVDCLLGSDRERRTDTHSVRHGFRFPAVEVKAAERQMAEGPFGGGQ